MKKVVGPPPLGIPLFWNNILFMTSIYSVLSSRIHFGLAYNDANQLPRLRKMGNADEEIRM
jgi:hypothetical protein